MKLQQSSVPFLLFLSFLVIGIPVTEQILTNQAERNQVEIIVKSVNPSIANIDLEAKKQLK